MTTIRGISMGLYIGLSLVITGHTDAKSKVKFTDKFREVLGLLAQEENLRPSQIQFLNNELSNEDLKKIGRTIIKIGGCLELKKREAVHEYKRCAKKKLASFLGVFTNKQASEVYKEYRCPAEYYTDSLSWLKKRSKLISPPRNCMRAEKFMSNQRYAVGYSLSDPEKFKRYFQLLNRCYILGEKRKAFSGKGKLDLACREEITLKFKRMNQNQVKKIDSSSIEGKITELENFKSLKGKGRKAYFLGKIFKFDLNKSSCFRLESMIDIIDEANWYNKLQVLCIEAQKRQSLGKRSSSEFDSFVENDASVSIGIQESKIK